MVSSINLDYERAYSSPYIVNERLIFGNPLNLLAFSVRIAFFFGPMIFPPPHRDFIIEIDSPIESRSEFPDHVTFPLPK